MQRRVVVTGLGVVSSIGIGKEEFWDGIVNVRNGAGRITLFDTTDYKCKIASQVPNFDVSVFGIDQYTLNRLDRFSIFAEVAAAQAYKDSGLDLKGIEERTGVVIGTGVGGLNTLEAEHSKLLLKGPGKVSPFFIPKLMPNAAAGNISISHKLYGPSCSIASACASGHHSIISGLQDILLNDADIMFVGGSEATITPMGVSGFTNMKALTTAFNDSPERASRPFDLDRSGFVMGEGSGVMVLEELEHARKRGAHIYCEIIGYCKSSDGANITAPNVEGQARTMRLAIQKARINPDEIDYVNAHGTSTHLNDKTETAAIKLALGENHARRVYISSNKSQIGHLLGAAGAVETICCALALERGVVPATINYEKKDDTEEGLCDLDYVPNIPREAQIRTVIKNSFGFGGHNAVSIFKKFE